MPDRISASHRIRIHRHALPDMFVGHGLEESEAVRLFFILHNAAYVSRDPLPLVCPCRGNRSVLVYPQEVRSLRLYRGGVDITEAVLVEE